MGEYQSEPTWRSDNAPEHRVARAYIKCRCRVKRSGCGDRLCLTSRTARQLRESGDARRAFLPSKVWMRRMRRGD